MKAHYWCKTEWGNEEWIRVKNTTTTIIKKKNETEEIKLQILAISICVIRPEWKSNCLQKKNAKPKKTGNTKRYFWENN